MAQAPMHFEHEGKMPPGAIGSQRLARGGAVYGYYQPVEIAAPQGAAISPAVNGQFAELGSSRLLVGMLIGAVYRLRVTGIPLQPGLEVYPTVEIIDRTYPPRRLAKRFPIRIELAQDELEMALEGKFVIRVIYIEEPTTALPIVEDPEHQSVFEVAHGDDPLAVADRLGRPVAILRLGGRVPEMDAVDAEFLFGCPPLVHLHQTSVAEYLQQFGAPPPEAPDLVLPEFQETPSSAGPAAVTPSARNQRSRRKALSPSGPVLRGQNHR